MGCLIAKTKLDLRVLNLEDKKLFNMKISIMKMILKLSKLLFRWVLLQLLLDKQNYRINESKTATVFHE